MNYDLKQISLMAGYSCRVYDTDYKFFDSLHYKCNVYEIPETSTVAVLLESRTDYVLVVRGTDKVKDVITNLEFFRHSDKELKTHVHRGFRKASHSLLKLLPSLSPKKPITITGHSLGGALAVLTGLHLLNNGKLIKQVITFGQPKVITAQFFKNEKLSSMPLLRVVYADDPVPLLPPRIFGCWFHPYKHFGNECYLCKEETAYTINNFKRTVTGESWKFSKMILKGKLSFSDIKFHHIYGYEERLKLLLQSELQSF